MYGGRTSSSYTGIQNTFYSRGSGTFATPKRERPQSVPIPKIKQEEKEPPVPEVVVKDVSPEPIPVEPIPVEPIPEEKISNTALTLSEIEKELLTETWRLAPGLLYDNIPPPPSPPSKQHFCLQGTVAQVQKTKVIQGHLVDENFRYLESVFFVTASPCRISIEIGFGNLSTGIRKSLLTGSFSFPGTGRSHQTRTIVLNQSLPLASEEVGHLWVSFRVSKKSTTSSPQVRYLFHLQSTEDFDKPITELEEMDDTRSEISIAPSLLRQYYQSKKNHPPQKETLPEQEQQENEEEEPLNPFYRFSKQQPLPIISEHPLP